MRTRGLLGGAVMAACGGGPGAGPPELGMPAVAFIADDEALYRYADLDGDGDYNDAGEQTRFFDKVRSPWGFEAVTGLLALDGTTVLATNNAQIYPDPPLVNTILRLEDLDGDGAAYGPGESRVWFSGILPDGSAMTTLYKLALGPDGGVYTSAYKTSASGPFPIYRFHDDNSDGDADDPGEIITVAAVTDHLVQDVAADANGTAWFIDDGLGPPGSVYSAGGAVEQVIDGEQLYAKSKISIGLGRIEMLPDDVLVFDALSGAGAISLAAARHDANGAVNVGVIWSTRPELFSNIDDFSVLEDGSILSVEAYSKKLMRLVDANGDGDYLDPGEGHFAYDPAVASQSGQVKPQQFKSMSGSVR